MKRACLTATLIGLAILVGGSGVLRAETPLRGYHFFVAPSLGFAVSPEEFTDYYVTGYGIQLGLEYPASPNWSLVGSADYRQFSPDEGLIAGWWPEEYANSTNIKVSEGTLSLFTLSLVGKGMLKTEGSATYPYVKGGFGIAIGGADQVKIDFTNSGGGPQTEWEAGADSDANIAIITGFGLEHELGDGTKAFFIDVGIYMVMLEDSYNPTGVPITIGLKF